MGIFSFIDVMGLRLHDVTLRQLANSCLGGEKLGMVVTPNAHFFVVAERDVATRELYNSADLSVCDSRIVQRLLFLANLHIPLVAGSDLTECILRDPRAKDLRICLIGGRADYQEIVAHKFSLSAFQQVDFPWKKEFSDAEIREICASISGEFDIALICLGAPLQERVASTLREFHLDRFPTILCVGASVDFLVGAQKRSPELLQRLGLEWAYRFATNPIRLFRRYFIECPTIFLIYVKWLLAHRFTDRQVTDAS